MLASGWSVSLVWCFAKEYLAALIPTEQGRAQHDALSQRNQDLEGLETAGCREEGLKDGELKMATD
jgi:hypothetical protein